MDHWEIVENLMVVICTKIGITNHDEYSLVLEDFENEENIENTNYERDVKINKLRKLLRTDDELNWVDPSKPLREQGIDDNDTVILRRKFFYSHQSIDSRYPIQLKLLYVQPRNAILDGTHPITQEKACEFAGVPCHIQFGPYNETKHKPGLLKYVIY